METKEAKEFCDNIVLNGTPEEKRELFRFGNNTNHRIIVKKFKYFSRGLYPRYFKGKSAPFHEEMIQNMLASYYGLNYLNIAFRGSAKTSLKKLFDVFVLLNDDDCFRRHIKVLTSDMKNSKQIVTDVYNLIVEVKDVYGNPFEKEGDIKREETQGSFTMRSQRKYTAGTVGQRQRGHIQDAYRPDWIWFEDVEDRDSIRSAAVTKGIIERIDEAIQGMSKDADGSTTNGSYTVTANYISDQGSIQWFINKPSVKTQITALTDEDGVPTWSIYSLEDVEVIKKDAEDYFGEYMCDPKRSVNKFFDIEKIEEDMKKCVKPLRDSAGVKYWGNYKPNHRYGQASDHSDGVGLDANTLAGFNYTEGKLIYTYANNLIAPDLAAYEFARVGSEYGNCKYAPEINNKCGGVVLTTLKHINYPNIHTQEKDDNVVTNKTDKLGWETNSKTKRTMFFEFKKDYNDGLIIILDIEVLKEMKAYTNNDLNESTAGLITRHFDLLTAVVIAWQMRKYATLTVDKVKSYRAKYDNYIASLG